MAEKGLVWMGLHPSHDPVTCFLISLQTHESHRVTEHRVALRRLAVEHLLILDERIFGPTASCKNPCQLDARLHIPRIVFECRRKLLDGLRVAPLRFHQDAETEMRPRELW